MALRKAGGASCTAWTVCRYPRKSAVTVLPVRSAYLMILKWLARPAGGLALLQCLYVKSCRQEARIRHTLIVLVQ